MLSTVADTHSVTIPARLALLWSYPPSLGGGRVHPTLGLSCPEQENGSCSASLSPLVSTSFKVPASPLAPDPEKGSRLASCQRPLLCGAALPAPPASACSAAGRETPAAGDSCPWTLAKPHKRAGQGSTLPGSLAEWAKKGWAQHGV